MEQNLFPRYADLIREMSEAELAREIQTPVRLCIEKVSTPRHQLQMAYAPFDHVESEARLVIVGITPGRQQMSNALMEARRLLRTETSVDQVIAKAKVHASFSGPMRSNLVAMLDFIGVNRLLGIPSTLDLWGRKSSLIHFTSALRYPVFVNGTNYAGQPKILETPLLKSALERWLGYEIGILRSALFVPLGPVAEQAVQYICAKHRIENDRVLSGLPHPSGANAERISFFLDRKSIGDLSSKVSPEKILANRAALTIKVQKLGR